MGFDVEEAIGDTPREPSRVIPALEYFRPRTATTTTGKGSNGSICQSLRPSMGLEDISPHRSCLKGLGVLCDSPTFKDSGDCAIYSGALYNLYFRYAHRLQT